MRRNWVGAALLAFVVIGSALYAWVGGLDGLRRVAPERVDLTIYFGGEKSRFLRNPDLLAILSRYGVALEAIRAGSIEMAADPDLSVDGVACLWPSNDVAVELARDAGRPVRSDTNIFNSPIVFYAWDEIADALETAGVARRREDGFWVADVTAMVALIESGARWREDLDVNVFGPVRVLSTDPTRSNSGNIWAALMATALNGGETPTPEDLPALLPRLVGYFERMGYMEDSSGDIFENFLRQGMGSRPIIVGYENQLIEFLIENGDAAARILDRIRIIYPEPTIFASHPLIALSGECGRLIEALEDPEAQALAWAAHGFRSGLIGVENDPDAISVRLPETVTLVAPMPSAAVMSAIIGALR